MSGFVNHVTVATNDEVVGSEKAYTQHSGQDAPRPHIQENRLYVKFLPTDGSDIQNGLIIDMTST